MLNPEHSPEQKLWIHVLHQIHQDALAYVRGGWPEDCGTLDDLHDAFQCMYEQTADFEAVCWMAGQDPREYRTEFMGRAVEMQSFGRVISDYHNDIKTPLPPGKFFCEEQHELALDDDDYWN